MKIHRPLAEASAAILDSILNHGSVADHTLRDAFLSNPRWGKRDRHFIAASVFECVRWRRQLAFLCNNHSPPALLLCHWQLSGYDPPTWTTLPWQTPSTLQLKLAELPSQPRAIRESYPDWLDHLAANQLGEEIWDREATALNAPAPIILRCNPLRMPLHKLINALQARNIPVQTLPNLPLALIVAQNHRIPNDLASEGWFEIQDAHSQHVAPFLQVEPGMRVMDACAGAGGKTLHLGALMQNKGELLAHDHNPQRLAPLPQRAIKAGIRNLQILPPNQDSLNTLHGKLDRLLLDVPCSGLGTLRRQPDIKWRLTKDRLNQLQETQAQILRKFSPLLRKDGLLVYSTCSLLPSENQHQISSFLNEHPAFILEDQKTLTPATGGHDGFHMARLRRISPSP